MLANPVQTVPARQECLDLVDGLPPGSTAFSPSCDTDTTRKDGLVRPTADQLRQLWRMTKLPQEDVLFTPTYESAGTGPDGKPLATAMVAMFTDEPGSFSDMHRLPTDEIWHFYLGDPIELLLLHPDGRDELIVLGTDVLDGQRVQCTVGSGAWMGARLRPGGEYGVYGNTMAPGFVPSDFEPGDRADLSRRWPHRGDLIAALTRS